MSEWSKIETAPKDGRALLVWFPEWVTAQVVFWDDGWLMMFGTRGRMGMRGQPQATHWQPLPAPPGS